MMPPMPTVARYYLPAPVWKPRGKPYPSGWKMTAAEAAERGLTDADIVPGTTEEVKEAPTQSAGQDGVRG